MAFPCLGRGPDMARPLFFRVFNALNFETFLYPISHTKFLAVLPEGQPRPGPKSHVCQVEGFFTRKPCAISGFGNGAACVTRTRDPRITNAMLYRLS